MASWPHWRKIEAQVTHTSDAATHKKKLPQSNFLHSLLIAIECTNGATSNQGNGITDAVDSIKVVRNGSEVLYHLEPETIRVLSLADLGTNLEETRDEQAAAVQKAVYPLLFGRKLYDPNHYLPLSPNDDIEVQIEYSPTISATTFATGTFKSTVLGLMTMDGRPGNYEGTLITRIIKNFTSAASGVEEVKPGQRYPWRKMFVRCYEAGLADGSNLTNVELELNDGARSPVNLGWGELHHLNMALNPVWVHKMGTLFWQDADTIPTLLSRIRAVNLEAVTTDAVATDGWYRVKPDSWTGDTVTICASVGDIVAGSEALTADATDRAIFAEIVSEGLPFTVEVPLNVEDRAPYFNSKAYDEIKLLLTQGNAGGDCDVVLQEVAALSQ